jgi:hypothetical protein
LEPLFCKRIKGLESWSELFTRITIIIIIMDIIINK